jgi:adenylate cyclase
LFLFLPFVAQWAAGNLIVSSGVVLWGLLAPIGAILCIGARESIGWFVAWIVLTALSGGADYYLADLQVLQKPVVPISTSLLFFTLNFVGVASVAFALLVYFIEQKRKAQERLERSRRQVQTAKEAADYIFISPFV